MLPVPDTSALEPCGSTRGDTACAFATWCKRRTWKFYSLVGAGVVFVILAIVATYFYIGFSKMIDARLAGETQRSDPRIFARPYECGAVRR